MQNLRKQNYTLLWILKVQVYHTSLNIIRNVEEEVVYKELNN